MRLLVMGRSRVPWGNGACDRTKGSFSIEANDVDGQEYQRSGGGRLGPVSALQLPLTTATGHGMFRADYQFACVD